MAARLEQAPDVVEILGGVHAARVVTGFDHANRVAVLEHAQLLERFGSFERPLARSPAIVSRN